MQVRLTLKHTALEAKKNWRGLTRDYESVDIQAGGEDTKRHKGALRFFGVWFRVGEGAGLGLKVRDSASKATLCMISRSALLQSWSLLQS